MTDLLSPLRVPGFFCLLLQPIQWHTLLRTIATARIVLPTTIIRLAAGRQTLDESKQAMCFMAGANAVFTGEQMLTTPCTCVINSARWATAYRCDV